MAVWGAAMENAGPATNERAHFAPRVWTEAGNKHLSSHLSRSTRKGTHRHVMPSDWPCVAHIVGLLWGDACKSGAPHRHLRCFSTCWFAAVKFSEARVISLTLFVEAPESLGEPTLLCSLNDAAKLSGLVGCGHRDHCFLNDGTSLRCLRSEPPPHQTRKARMSPRALLASVTPSHSWVSFYYHS